MERMTTQKDWLDYINRLQERERQKIISSGLTNWVLLLAVMGLAYWLYPDIINIQKNWLSVLVGYTVFTNIYITIFDIINKYYREDKIKKINNPDNELDEKGLILLKTHQFIMLLLSTGLNILFAYIVLKNEKYLFLIYFLIYILRFFFQLMYEISLTIPKEYININEENLNRKEPKLKKTYKFFIFFMKIILGNTLKVIMTIIFISYIFKCYNFENILWKQIFDGFALVIIFALFQSLIMIFIKRLKIAWLENLEKEIILYHLREEQIIEKLKKGYLNNSNIDNYF